MALSSNDDEAFCRKPSLSLKLFLSYVNTSDWIAYFSLDFTFSQQHSFRWFLIKTSFYTYF